MFLEISGHTPADKNFGRDGTDELTKSRRSAFFLAGANTRQAMVIYWYAAEEPERMG
jgi:hypothetical protein